MPLLEQCVALARKYGTAARLVAVGVLNVVAPGSGTLIDLAGRAVEATQDIVEKTAQEHWQRELLDRLQQNEGELVRLGQLLEFLTGPLATVCDKARAFADQPDDLPEIIARAIAADPKLSRILHEVGGLKEQFGVFQHDMKRLAERQEEAVPVYARMNRVADYFDELWQAGVRPKDFAHCARGLLEAAQRVEHQDTAELDHLLLELRTTTPKASSVCVLEAAAAMREFNYPAAVRALSSANRLKPGDAELVELSRHVTVLATGVTPPTLPPPPSPRLQPGDTLDGWLLETRLGAGGWGQVFKATRDGQTRAIKVMHAEFAHDAAFVSRFKKEIASLFRLPRHPNLVRIDDDGFGKCARHNTWYLSMEYVDGPTLEQYLASKGPLGEGQVRKVFLDSIEGLAKAHAAGIVHRDIKPSNLIFRKSDQRLVFVDFGLAVGVEDFGQTKVSGLTIQFAAPEQHYGERATQASDVFSLCAVIYYALNYSKPDLRKPNRFSESVVPASLRAALSKGMKHNASERLSDGEQLRRAFSSVATPAEEVKISVPPPEPARPRTEHKIGDTIEVPLSATVKMKLAWVPPGTSWLGGGGGKPGTEKFTLETGLWCGVYPVTQTEWQAVMGDNPSHFKSKPRNPVENVSWDCVQEFLKALNAKHPDGGLSFRLPTEQEWEYICRGGPISQDQSKYHFYFAKSKTDLTPVPTNDLSSKQANFDGKHPAGSAAKGPYLFTTSEVGSYLPNPLGIYDLAGNVWEWTASEKGSDRVFRGGSWYYLGGFCSASYRNWDEPSIADGILGFRLLAVPVGS